MQSLDRRTFLSASLALAGGLALSGCERLNASLAAALDPAQAIFPAPQGRPAPALFAALNRLTFGPRPAEIARAAEIGLAGWIEEQLAPASIDDGLCDLRLRPLDTLKMTAVDLFDLSDKIFDDQDRHRVPAELRRAALLRQIYSRRQVYERMVEFWTDHFNISVEKGECFCLKTVDDREVIRPHALGSFRELLWASAHSPAMLVYLDNAASEARAPNENYARELLELHTLGLDGGYTQQDVMELARCLTGWGVKERFWKGEFEFRPERHDPSEKTVLGMRIQPGGQAEGEQVLETLATHPATASFITRKLARRFLCENPPAALLDRAARVFRETSGDLRAVLRLILLDGLPALEPRYKRPADFVVSALRQLDAQTSAGTELQGWIARMGMPYFAWPTPDGYPDRSAAWQGSLLPRWQFALALAHGEIGDTRIDWETLAGECPAADLPRALSLRLLGSELPSGFDLGALLFPAGIEAGEQAAAAALTGAAILSSPPYQWK